MTLTKLWLNVCQLFIVLWEEFILVSNLQYVLTNAALCPLVILVYFEGNVAINNLLPIQYLKNFYLVSSCCFCLQTPTCTVFAGVRVFTCAHVVFAICYVLLAGSSIFARKWFARIVAYDEYVDGMLLLLLGNSYATPNVLVNNLLKGTNINCERNGR